jgi:hypothetical protein
MTISSSRVFPFDAPPFRFAPDEVGPRLLEPSRVPVDPVDSSGLACIEDDDIDDEDNDDAAAATFNCRVVTVVVVVTGTAFGVPA